MLTEGRRRLVGEGVPLGDVSVLLERAECDVAVLVAHEGAPLEPRARDARCSCRSAAPSTTGPRWSSARGCPSATGAPLKLLGAGRAERRGQLGHPHARRRRPASCSRATGIATEPLVIAGGREGIVAAAAGAGLLVIGLSERWRREGLGPTRSEIAKAAPAPVLFVRRGSRAGPVRSARGRDPVQLVDGRQRLSAPRAGRHSSPMPRAAGAASPDGGPPSSAWAAVDGRLGSARSGSTALTRVGPPACELTYRRPPRSAARSRIPISPKPCARAVGLEAAAVVLHAHLHAVVQLPHAHVTCSASRRAGRRC